MHRNLIELSIKHVSKSREIFPSHNLSSILEKLSLFANLQDFWMYSSPKEISRKYALSITLYKYNNILEFLFLIFLFSCLLYQSRGTPLMYVVWYVCSM